MYQRGQTTSFQVRLEIMVQASAGLHDTQIAAGLGCSLWTVRKWRRRSLKRGRVGLASQMGRPASGPMSTFPQELQEAIHHLRKRHPGWGPATLLVTLKMDAYWRDQPLPNRAHLLIRNGKWTWHVIMRVEGVGKVSLNRLIDFQKSEHFIE